MCLRMISILNKLQKADKVPETHMLVSEHHLEKSGWAACILVFIPTSCLQKDLKSISTNYAVTLKSCPRRSRGCWHFAAEVPLMKDMDGEEERTAGRKRRAPERHGNMLPFAPKAPQHDSTSRRKRDAPALVLLHHLALQHAKLTTRHVLS